MVSLFHVRTFRIRNRWHNCRSCTHIQKSLIITYKSPPHLVAGGLFACYAVMSRFMNEVKLIARNTIA